MVLFARFCIYHIDTRPGTRIADPSEPEFRAVRRSVAGPVQLFRLRGHRASEAPVKMKA